MEKPVSVAVEELRSNIVQTINAAGLNAILVVPIVKDIYMELKGFADKQYKDDLEEYQNYLAEEAKEKASESSESTEEVSE